MGNEKNNDEIIFDIVPLVKELFKYTRIIIAVMLIFGIFGFTYTKLCMPLMYTTSTSLYVKSIDESAVITANIQTLDASKSLAETYIVILSNDAVMDVVANKMFEICTPEEINQYFSIIEDESGNSIINPKSILRYLTFETVNETEIIQISATTPNPAISAEICRVIADTAPTVIGKVVGTGNIETINEAKVPLTPSGPNAKKNAVLSALLGFLLISGFIIARYVLNRTITTGEDFKLRYNIPVLSEIPEYGTEDTDNNKSIARKYLASLRRIDAQSRNTLGNIIDSKTPFSVVEAYNLLRTNLNFTLSTRENNVFIVSSPLSGDGKSTTVANIAITLTQTNAKVLIVDCDLRRPSQHIIFNLSNEKGLSTALIDKKFEDNIAKNVHSGLDVLTAGPTPPNPSELLGSKVMETLIENVKDKYDYVILDTSPVNVVTDAILLSKLAAGVMMIVRQNISTYDEVNKAIDSINFIDGNILGVVINSTENKSTKYGKKKYGYGYGYGESPKAESSNKKTVQNNSNKKDSNKK